MKSDTTKAEAVGVVKSANFQSLKYKVQTAADSLIARWGMLVLWCAFIYFLSAQSSLPGPTMDWANFVFHKVAHLFFYAVLYLLALRAFHQLPKTQRMKTALVFVLTYAISDELHQTMTPGRTPSIPDIGYDMIGALGMWLKTEGYI